MFQNFFKTLQDTPPVPASNILSYARECVRVCDLIIDTLREEALIPHPALHALMTLMWYLVGKKAIPMMLDPSEGTLPTLTFCCLVRRPPRPDLAFFAVPTTFLELVKADPLAQCCAMVHMASQGCDYYSQRLDLTHTPQRAQAYEAELLLTVRPRLEQEALSWEPNAYLQEVLAIYPAGLASLPADQRYLPPTYTRHESSPERN